MTSGRESEGDLPSQSIMSTTVPIDPLKRPYGALILDVSVTFANVKTFGQPTSFVT